MRSEPSQPFFAATDRRDPAEPSVAADSPAASVELDPATLIDQLRLDRLWLLRQIDSGQWGEWRLDLAALERELGQLLEQASERLLGS